MSDFKKKDDAWFAQDLPVDVEGLDTIITNQQVIWDDLRPGVTFLWKTTDSDDNTPTTFSRRYTSPQWEALLVVPLLLQPGDKTIKAHFRGRGDGPDNAGVYLQFREGLVANYDTFDTSVQMDLVTGNDFEVKVLTIDNLDVPVPRLTFLQFYYKSVLQTSPTIVFPTAAHGPLMSGQSGTGPYAIDKEAVLATISASASLPKHLYFFYTVDVSNNIVQRFKVVDWDTGVTAAPPSGSETSAPRLDGTLVFPYPGNWPEHVDDHGYGQANWLEPRSLSIEVIREAAAPPSKFYTLRGSDARPGHLTKSKVGTGLVAGNNTLRFRKRPNSIHLPTEGNIGDNLDPSSHPTCSTAAAYEQYITISRVHQMDSLRLFCILGAIEDGFPSKSNRDPAQVKITLELMDAGASGHTAKGTPITANETFSVPFTDPRRENNLFQYWDDTNAEGCLSPSDIDQLLAGREFVVAEVVLDGLANGASLGVDEEPDILRVKMEIVDTNNVMPFKYSVHMATAPMIYQESGE